MLLRELLNIEQIGIIKEDKTKDGNTMSIKVPFCEADKKTKNGRIYSEWLLKRELEKVKDKVESGAFLGTGDHSEDGKSKIGDISHIVTQLELNEKTGWAWIKVLPTEKGRAVQTIVREGGKLGISMRGFGNVSKDTGQVQGDYNFVGLDIVCDPSVKIAQFDKSNILESLDFGERPTAPSEEIIEDILKNCYEQAVENYGYNKGIDAWMEKNRDVTRALILCEYDVYPDVKTALIAAGKDPKLAEKSEKEPKIWTGAELYLEARLCNVSPDEMAKRLNKAEELKRINEESGVGVEAAKRLVDEAIQSGFDLSDPEKRKAYFAKIEEMAVSEPTLHERSLQVQKRLKAKGTEATLETIQRVLVFDDKQKEIKKRRQRLISALHMELEFASGTMTNEQTRKFINRQLRKANLPELSEDGD